MISIAQLKNYFDTKVAEIIKNITGIANFKKTNLGTKRYAVVKNLLIMSIHVNQKQFFQVYMYYFDNVSLQKLVDFSFIV